ncbi:MAG: M16 family metallopeptidase [Brevundimonas sp.]|uniref:M16 family metallopeptidase n=1 Tax=Brevundimonas sp. TaxID=1871086 RepID=UPI00391DE251
MPGLKTFALTVAVRGGARWEDEHRSGWSHLLEHLVFKGAGEMSAREIVQRIEAEGGSINAATGQERTSFEVRAMEASLPLAMQVVSDIVFRPTLSEAEVAREKDVVAQEIAEAFDTPDDHVFEMAGEKAFTGQPLGRPILGSVESIGRADRAGMQAWRAALYAPHRMVVAVSGAVDPVRLGELAEAWFGQAGHEAAEEPAHAAFTGGDAALTRRIEQANLVFEIPGLSAHDPDTPALRLFAEILGGGMASRLFQSAREDRGLAYAVDAWFEGYEDTGVLGVYAGAAPGRSEELARVAATELRSLAMDGPTGEELARAKAILSASLWMADESPASRAGRNAAQTLLFGAPVPSETLTARVAAVTGEDLQRLGGRLLASGKSATAVLGPKAAGHAGRVFAETLYA